MHGRRSIVIAFALFLTLVTLAIGYVAFGLTTAAIFTSGFLGGFMLWLIVPSNRPWSEIRSVYWITLALFIVHRVEEKQMGFFKELASITNVPTPEITSVPVISLVIISVGAWLLIPYLVKRRVEFGYYLAWTFFAAMGITELTHFALPLFTDRPYGYFPGMASVVLLAPVAWWGMWRLSRKEVPFP